MWKPYVDPALASLTAGSTGLQDMYNMTKQAGTFDKPTFSRISSMIWQSSGKRCLGMRNMILSTL
jgi:hypothetical protein